MLQAVHLIATFYPSGKYAIVVEDHDILCGRLFR